MVDESLYLSDRAKPKSDAWKRGPKITLDDMITANRAKGLERMRPGELHGKTKNGEPAQSRGRLTFSFGKYRGRLVADILEENPGYVQWAVREVDGFRAKVEAAGIEIEGDDFE